MKSESSSPPFQSLAVPKNKLGWLEWLRGWFYVMQEIMFQRILASHLESPLTLPPINGQTCIVTGSTSGIGLEIARQLAESGAHVVMAVRNTTAATDLIHKWQNERSEMGFPLNIEVMGLNLLSLNSVVRFADNYNSRLIPLNVLVNNAGIFSIGGAQRFSEDGYEEHLQVNHLAPALLSLLLLPSLLRGSPSRIVNVNSVIHHVGFVDTDDMNMTSGRRKYTSLRGYANSKMALVMFSNALYTRLPAVTGISVICVSPGCVHTNVARDLPKFIQMAYHLIPYFIFSPREGSRSAVFAATDRQMMEYCETLKGNEWPACAYVSHDCRPTSSCEEAQDVAACVRVWDKTLHMIGLPSDALEILTSGGTLSSLYAHADAS